MKYLLTIVMLLLSGIQSYATISLTQSNSAETNNVTSQACTLSGAVAAGDLIIATGRVGATGVTVTGTDNHNAGNYSQISGSPVNNGSISNYLIYIVNSNSQSSLTVTVTISASNRLQVACFDYNTTVGAWTLAASSTNSNSSNVLSGSAGSITNSGLVFSSIATTTSVASQAVNSPCTIQTAGGSGSFGGLNHSWGGDDENVSSGSRQCTFTWTTSSGFAAVVGGFSTGSPNMVPTVL